MYEDPNRAVVFHKYSCGCIGIPISRTALLLVDACDQQVDEDDLGLGIREMSEEKEHSPISLAEQEELVNRLGRLIHLGYRMKDLANTISFINRK